MTVYESVLTPGNLKNFHIYITPFLGVLPAEVIGSPSKDQPARKPIRLEFEAQSIETDVPTTQRGRPRNFFRARGFVRSFFERTGAVAGDTVQFEEIAPAHYRLSLRKSAV